MFGVEPRKGSMRVVFLTKRWAVKVPRLSSWRVFLEGVIANLEERAMWRKYRSPALCPVSCADPLGFLLVMPHARAPSDSELNVYGPAEVQPAELANAIGADCKRENFGVIDGQIVKIDYGGCWWVN